MRYATRIILNSETLEIVSADWGEWNGQVWLLKGDSTAKAAEVDQASFDKSLMAIFQSQYAKQAPILDYLSGKMQAQINNPSGYTPDQLTAMRTGATDTDASQLTNAESTLNNQISMASGGSKLVGVSGAEVQQKAALLDAEAQKQATDQNAITTQNANLQQQNYWNAVNVLSGTAAQYNPQSYASGATSGSGAVASASNAYTNSNQSQLLGALGGVVGGAASGILSGGMANLGKGVGFFG
jgi:hypothetical protein